MISRVVAVALVAAVVAAQQVPQEFCGTYVAVVDASMQNEASEIQVGTSNAAYWSRYEPVANQHPPAPPFKTLSYTSFSSGNSSVCFTARLSALFQFNQPGWNAYFPKMPVNYTGIVNVTFWGEESGKSVCSPNNPAAYLRMYTGLFNRTNNVCYSSAVTAAVGLPALALLVVAAWRSMMQ